MNNKEAILLTIDKIAHLAMQPENKWLQRELLVRFGVVDAEMTNSDHELIEKIERYLSLDNKLEQVTNTIGYDYIEFGHLREKLVSDWLEMKRNRYGIAERPISYVDFCSHVHFQAEGIINYYHYKRNNGICDIDWLNVNIDEYTSKNPKFSIKKITRISVTGKPTTLDDINYSTKKCIFFNVVEREGIIHKSKIFELSQIMGFVQKVRNVDAVHRSPTSEFPMEKKYSYEAIEYALSEVNILVRKLITKKFDDIL